VDRGEWRWVLLVTLVLIVASSLPYLVAWGVTPKNAHFTGLVFNPQDGNSYIAKMRHGMTGSWLFRLPYTPEPHDGAPVYLFYLFWGHVARWMGLGLIAIYHCVRVAGGAVMLLSFYTLVSSISEDVGERRIMFTLAALGSGLGWVAGFLGLVTSDLWVPEAFPAYALLTNAHFPLAIGLMVGIMSCGQRIVSSEWRDADGDGHVWTWGLGMALAAVILGVIQPFGLVTVFGGLGVTLAVQSVRERSIPWRVTAWVIGAGVVALAYPVYMQRALHADPVLAAWSAQNVTASPPLWDWALSSGLVSVLAVPGIAFAVRRGSVGDWLLLGWLLVTLVGIVVPLPLQRRLGLGLGVPMGLLAGIGWWRTLRPRVAARSRRLVQGLMVAFCAMTPIFLVLIALVGALAGEPWFYLSDGEWAALEWLRVEGDPNAVVLCAPQTGLFVPAWAGQPVVYGHPFETVNAEQRREQVEAYWAGEMSVVAQESFLRENRVGYVLVGPRELGIGDWRLENRGWTSVFEVEGVSVYEVR
jgi:hypothetical protein